MTVLRAPLSSAAPVTPGVYASVHFRASLADGTLLHDSRAQSEPLEVRVGADPSDAAPAWDLALAQMRVGEMVRVDCSPEYAYGEKGAPPLIPPNAAMTFELELLSIRDLMSSHNPEEVDFLDRYRELTENRERSHKATGRPPPPAADSRNALRNDLGNDSEDECPPEIWEKIAKKTKNEPSAPNAPASRERVATSKTELMSGSPGHPSSERPISTRVQDSTVTSQTRGRAWIPEKQRIEGKHVSGYTWVETFEDLEVRILLPPQTKPQDIDCEIRRKSLRVSVAGQTPLLDGPLWGTVDLDGSAWVIERTEEGGADTGSEPPVRLVVTLLKAEPSDDYWGYPMYDPSLDEDTDLPPPSEHEKNEPGLSAFGSIGVEWANGP